MRARNVAMTHTHARLYISFALMQCHWKSTVRNVRRLNWTKIRLFYYYFFAGVQSSAYTNFIPSVIFACEFPNIFTTKIFYLFANKVNNLHIKIENGKFDFPLSVNRFGDGCSEREYEELSEQNNEGINDHRLNLHMNSLSCIDGMWIEWNSETKKLYRKRRKRTQRKWKLTMVLIRSEREKIISFI